MNYLVVSGRLWGWVSHCLGSLLYSRVQKGTLVVKFSEAALILIYLVDYPAMSFGNLEPSTT